MRPQQFKRLFVLSILYNLLFYGWIMNLGAMAINGGKMPVQGDTPLVNENTHFLFQDKDEVEGYYLTDIVGFGRYKWSIGDLIVIPTLIFIVLYGVYSIRNEAKEWSMER